MSKRKFWRDVDRFYNEVADAVTRRDGRFDEAACMAVAIDLALAADGKEPLGADEAGK